MYDDVGFDNRHLDLFDVFAPTCLPIAKYDKNLLCPTRATLGPYGTCSACLWSSPRTSLRASRAQELQVWRSSTRTSLKSFKSFKSIGTVVTFFKTLKYLMFQTK